MNFTIQKDLIMTIRNSRFVAIISLTLLLSACFKDKGNYEYNPINEIDIEGISEDYSVALGDKLTIIPDLSFTLDGSNDTANYTYEWFALRKDGVLPGDVRKDIALTRNLDVIITIPPGPYRAYYRVTDKNSGIQWQKTFNLTVVSSIYEGWMLMNDVDGSTRVH
jgi:hypothetical protein